MKLIKSIFLLSLVLVFASCGTMTKSQAYSVKTELNLTMEDLVFLGESEISCEYDSYFGCIQKLNTVNGVRYVPGNKKALVSKNGYVAGGLNFSNKGMRMAAADLIQTYPEGCYYQLVMQTTEKDVMFLGATVKHVAKVRVYKFK